MSTITMANDLAKALRTFELSSTKSEGRDQCSEDIAKRKEVCQLSLLRKIPGEKNFNVTVVQRYGYGKGVVCGSAIGWGCVRETKVEGEEYRKQLRFCRVESFEEEESWVRGWAV
ncbi:hypothetical protein ACH5RR_039567 [Cinchona calisaya]|uniref:Uncharacterized protein n=1 Tax=Cinchona calisaya TaxID=153742 RepID=A0ABD2XYM9_9GENT